MDSYLRAEQERRGWSMNRTVAEYRRASGRPMSKSAWLRLLDGETRLTMDHLIAIAQMFDLEVGDVAQAVALSLLPSRPPTPRNSLAAARLQLGLTQEELARSAGVSRSYVSLIEGEELLASARVRAALARALGVSESDLFDSSGLVLGVGA